MAPRAVCDGPGPPTSDDVGGMGHRGEGRGGVGKAWQRPTLPCLPGTVPWALRGFTAEFGMGSGGAPALGHQAFPTPSCPTTSHDVVGAPRYHPTRSPIARGPRTSIPADRRSSGAPGDSAPRGLRPRGGCGWGPREVARLRGEDVGRVGGCSGRGGEVPGLGRGERDRAIRTGWLSRLPCVHLRPIDVVVYHGSRRDLVWRWVSRLDAFSGYPVRTWLPGCAAGATTGPPEVRPPRSSRTEGGSAQVSNTHGR